jgi:hypothetical protein
MTETVIHRSPFHSVCANGRGPHSSGFRAEGRLRSAFSILCQRLCGKKADSGGAHGPSAREVRPDGEIAVSARVTGLNKNVDDISAPKLRPYLRRRSKRRSLALVRHFSGWRFPISCPKWRRLPHISSRQQVDRYCSGRQLSATKLE